MTPTPEEQAAAAAALGKAAAAGSASGGVPGGLPPSIHVEVIKENLEGVYADILAAAGNKELAQAGVKLDDATMWNAERPEVVALASKAADETFGALIKTAGKDLKTAMSEELSKTQDPFAIADAIRQRFDGQTRWQARRMVRTVTRDLYNAAALDRFEQMGVKTVTAHDGAGGLTGQTDPACIARNGQTYTIAEARKLKAYHPTVHPNCTLSWSPNVPKEGLRPPVPQSLIDTFMGADQSADGEMLELASDWQPDLHPRWPPGTPAGKGGEFMHVADLPSLFGHSIDADPSVPITFLAKGSAHIQSITASPLQGAPNGAVISVVMHPGAGVPGAKLGHVELKIKDTQSLKTVGLMSFLAALDDGEDLSLAKAALNAGNGKTKAKAAFGKKASYTHYQSKVKPAAKPADASGHIPVGDVPGLYTGASGLDVGVQHGLTDTHTELKGSGKYGLQIKDAHVDSSTHDPSIPIPKFSPVSAEQWKRFGREDQLRHTYLQEKFGKWSGSKGNSLMTELKSKMHPKLWQAVYDAHYAQKSSAGSGKQHFSLANANSMSYDQWQKLKGQIDPDGNFPSWAAALNNAFLQQEEIVQYDIYNRTGEADIMLVHAFSGNEIVDLIAAGVPLHEGMPMSFDGKWEEQHALFMPMPVRLLTKSWFTLIAHNHSSEHEFGVRYQKLVDPEHSFIVKNVGQYVLHDKVVAATKGNPVGGSWFDKLAAHFGVKKLSPQEQYDALPQAKVSTLGPGDKFLEAGTFKPRKVVAGYSDGSFTDDANHYYPATATVALQSKAPAGLYDAGKVVEVPFNDPKLKMGHKVYTADGGFLGYVSTPSSNLNGTQLNWKDVDAAGNVGTKHELKSGTIHTVMETQAQHLQKGDTFYVPGQKAMLVEVEDNDYNGSMVSWHYVHNPKSKGTTNKADLVWPTPKKAEDIPTPAPPPQGVKPFVPGKPSPKKVPEPPKAKMHPSPPAATEVAAPSPPLTPAPHTDLEQVTLGQLQAGDWLFSGENGKPLGYVSSQGHGESTVYFTDGSYAVTYQHGTPVYVPKAMDKPEVKAGTGPTGSKKGAKLAKGDQVYSYHTSNFIGVADHQTDDGGWNVAVPGGGYKKVGPKSSVKWSPASTSDAFIDQPENTDQIPDGTPVGLHSLTSGQHFTVTHSNAYFAEPGTTGHVLTSTASAVEIEWDTGPKAGTTFAFQKSGVEPDLGAVVTGGTPYEVAADAVPAHELHEVALEKLDPGAIIYDKLGQPIGEVGIQEGANPYLDEKPGAGLLPATFYPVPTQMAPGVHYLPPTLPLQVKKPAPLLAHQTYIGDLHAGTYFTDAEDGETYLIEAIGHDGSVVASSTIDGLPQTFSKGHVVTPFQPDNSSYDTEGYSTGTVEVGHLNKGDYFSHQGTAYELVGTTPSGMVYGEGMQGLDKVTLPMDTHVEKLADPPNDELLHEDAKPGSVPIAALKVGDQFYQDGEGPFVVTQAADAGVVYATGGPTNQELPTDAEAWVTPGDFGVIPNEPLANLAETDLATLPAGTTIYHQHVGEPIGKVATPDEDHLGQLAIAIANTSSPTEHALLHYSPSSKVKVSVKKEDLPVVPFADVPATKPAALAADVVTFKQKKAGALDIGDQVYSYHGETLIGTVTSISDKVYIQTPDGGEKTQGLKSSIKTPTQPLAVPTGQKIPAANAKPGDHIKLASGTVLQVVNPVTAAGPGYVWATPDGLPAEGHSDAYALGDTDLVELTQDPLSHQPGLVGPKISSHLDLPPGFAAQQASHLVDGQMVWDPDVGEHGTVLNKLFNGSAQIEWGDGVVDTYPPGEVVYSDQGPSSEPNRPVHTVQVMAGNVAAGSVFYSESGQPYGKVGAAVKPGEEVPYAYINMPDQTFHMAPWTQIAVHPDSTAPIDAPHPPDPADPPSGPISHVELTGILKNAPYYQNSELMHVPAGSVPKGTVLYDVSGQPFGAITEQTAEGAVQTWISTGTINSHPGFSSVTNDPNKLIYVHQDAAAAPDATPVDTPAMTPTNEPTHTEVPAGIAKGSTFQQNGLVYKVEWTDETSPVTGMHGVIAYVLDANGEEVPDSAKLIPYAAAPPAAGLDAPTPAAPPTPTPPPAPEAPAQDTAKWMDYFATQNASQWNAKSTKGSKLKQGAPVFSYHSGNFIGIASTQNADGSWELETPSGGTKHVGQNSSVKTVAHANVPGFTPATPATPAPVAPPAPPPTPAAPAEALPAVHNWGDLKLTLGKGVGGTQGAVQATDAQGNKYVVKTYGGNEDRVRTEALANAIYDLLGVPVAKGGILNINGKDAYVAAWVDGNTTKITKAKHGAALGEGFMTDALLANWDVLGLEDDNILWNNGVPYRIDLGSTFTYRAMGGTKKFGDVPKEVTSMRLPGHQGAKMAVTPDEMKAQAGQIAKILTPGEIDKLVASAYPPGSQLAVQYKAELKARVKWMHDFQLGKVTVPSA